MLRTRRDGQRVRKSGKSQCAGSCCRSRKRWQAPGFYQYICVSRCEQFAGQNNQNIRLSLCANCKSLRPEELAGSLSCKSRLMSRFAFAAKEANSSLLLVLTHSVVKVFMSRFSPLKFASSVDLQLGVHRECSNEFVFSESPSIT